MKKLALAAIATFTASAASANPFTVPEISALEGTAALATVVAIVLLIWERRNSQ